MTGYRRRALAVALTVYGAVGSLLIGIALMAVAGPLDGDEGPLGLEGQRRRLVAMIDATNDAIRDAETAAGNVDGSLGSTAEAAGSAGEFMGELATTSRSLAESLRIELFGGQPFGSAAADFERLAERAVAVEGDLEAAATSVSAAATDLGSLSADLAEMRVELAAIRTGIENRIDAGVWRLVAAAMLAWLAIPAIVSLILGLRWLRDAGSARREGVHGD